MPVDFCGYDPVWSKPGIGRPKRDRRKQAAARKRAKAARR